MTMITRWEPYRELNTLQERLHRLFEDSYARGADELMTAGSFVPAVDVYEDEHAITLKVEVPGIEQKDIDIRLESNTLKVRGERKFEQEEKEENFRHVERRYGAFERSFTLPETVDTDKVTAEYENGVLRIQLAKRAEAKPKQIKVTVAPKTIEAKGTGKAA